MSNSRSSNKNSWRVLDIVVASVIAVACGLIFWIWNSIGYAWFVALDAFTPGLGGLVAGIWLLGGVLGGIIIRKRGAAIYVEVLAACVSAVLGNIWGIETVLSGLAQGIGAEIVLAMFFYRKFTLPVAILSGIGAGAGAWALELVTRANFAKSLSYNLTYLSCLAISGAFLAGLLGYMLMRSLAQTGVLDRFSAGRETRQVI
ncbi:ECF transporter S component [Corynebacterium caspium]|uniref:ECF transporter S component n=1 Tax=Corynebacterium caspium TaxID=234828 RepID=UPI00036B048E|nr:ECF transporter S component [Corynebacterium caspium]WKD59526.1 Putative HMP/thiamine permease protein YkoE [Corynebacterium caspium DSM 44850]